MFLKLYLSNSSVGEIRVRINSHYSLLCTKKYKYFTNNLLLVENIIIIKYRLLQVAN